MSSFYSFYSSPFDGHYFSFISREREREREGEYGRDVCVEKKDMIEEMRKRNKVKRSNGKRDEYLRKGKG